MMLDRREPYANPYTEFGFKKPFGTEMNEELLVSSLNTLLVGQEKPITDINNAIRTADLEALPKGVCKRNTKSTEECQTWGLTWIPLRMPPLPQRDEKT